MNHPPQQDVYGFDARWELEPFVPKTTTSALEVGPGRGGFGRTLRDILGPDVRLVGVEPVSEVAEAARAAGDFNEVIEGFFPDALGDERFDLAIFNDVLEHMLDPWQVLRATHAHLADDGRVLASIPSIQYAPIVWELIRGRWDYLDSGTLDRTHVRFFTRETMIEMFEETGYVVEKCEGITSVWQRWGTDPNPVRRALKRALIPALGDAQYCQFAILARRA